MSDYYDILGINKNCTQDEIKTAFRKLAREHHPDKGGDKERFQQIQQAYETLSDPQKRDEYDNPMRFQQSSFGNSGFDFNIHTFFNNGHQQQKKKNNHHYTCKITLRDIYYGIRKNIRISKNNMCNDCNKTCDLCGGHGNISKRLQLGPIMQMLHQTCVKCSGSGKIKSGGDCSKCGSKGFILEEKIIEINVKRGSESEQQIIVESWGEQATKINEISGDLVINVVVIQHDHFVRQNSDLVYNTNISLSESIIGKIITIPHFEQPITLNISMFGIINPNKQYIIHNKGLVSENGNIGNLLIRFTVDYPDTKFTSKQIDELKSVFQKVNL